MKGELKLKEALKRGAFGAPIGVTIVVLFLIVESLIFGDGDLFVAHPDLVEETGSTLNAFIWEVVSGAFIGFGFSAASVVWEKDSWSLAKQSGVYLLAAAIFMLPVSYLMHWMDHTVSGVVIYLAVFLAIFAVIWIICYIAGKRQVRELNEKVGK